MFAAVADERRSIAALIAELDADQLATASLCAGWDVKTVAAHLVSDFEDGFWGFLASGLRHGGINRGIDALARSRAQCPAADIAETLRSRADYRLSPPVTGPLSGLTDVLVHVPISGYRSDFRISRTRGMSRGYSISSPAERNSDSFRTGACAASRCTMRTPGESGAKAGPSPGRASR